MKARVLLPALAILTGTTIWPPGTPATLYELFSRWQLEF